MPEPALDNDQTFARLEEQIRWYDQRSGRQRRSFYALKVVTIAAAAGIPLLAVILVDAYLNKVIASTVGALIVVIEGFQQLFQLQTNWLLYRSTCENLRHEKYLFLGNAGPYAAAQNPHALLAERIESLISQEHSVWISSQQSTQPRVERADPHAAKVK